MTFFILVAETLLAPFAALGVALSFLLSPRRGALSDLAAELPERLGGFSAEGRARLAGRRVWWLHAASAGEVGGLFPLIEALASRPDAPALLVTTTTAAGRAAARANPRVAWAQLAPLDAWPCVARFLRAVRPERFVLTETELWPTTIILAARAGLKPALINGRMTRRSLRRYRWIEPLIAPALESLAALAAQSETDAERFSEIGAPAARLSALGNTKYDRPSVAADVETARARLAELGWEKMPLFVAGSTHPVEEQAVIRAFLHARRVTGNLKLVMAPRHIERADEAYAALRRMGLPAARWRGWTEPGAEALLVDAMGLLPSLYALARAAFVGGTLVSVGGHNLLEPAAAGVPVLFGPYTDHVSLPARLLEAGGGGVRVADAAELAMQLDRLVASPEHARSVGARARLVSGSLGGATPKVLALLDELGR
jgi:3-deoxy-D-manno-octulosonic-acid transferase